MVLATDLIHMMDPSGAPQNVNFDEPVATFDARYILAGAAAPLGAEYVVISLDGDLTDERVLTGTANQISIADGGAGGNVTLATPQDIHNAATPTFAGGTFNGAVLIDGSADVVQLTVQANATQNANLQEWEDSGANVVLAIMGDGDIFTDRWLASETNTFIGVGVVGSGNLAHVAGNTGWRNVGLGWHVLEDLETGYDNVGIGYLACSSVTIGYGNVGIGVNANKSTTEGYQNFAIGGNSLFNNTLGVQNVGVGDSSLFSNIGGSYNFGLGFSALRMNTSGSSNIGIGSHANRRNTTAGFNIAIGDSANYNNQEGYYNTIIGSQAGKGTSAHNKANNVIIGYQAGFLAQDANNNILIGYQAGNVITTGDGNIIIGYDIDPSAADASYELNIGGYITGIIDDGTLLITSQNAATVPFTVKGAVAQSVNLQDWKDSDGDIFSHVLAGGELIQYMQTVAKAGAYVATVDDCVILCDANGGVFTITLTAANGNAGLNFHIKKTDNSVNAVTIDGNAGETIDGDLTVDITDQYESLHIVCDGSNWHVL
jgi:hypothetical protein